MRQRTLALSAAQKRRTMSGSKVLRRKKRQKRRPTNSYSLHVLQALHEAVLVAVRGALAARRGARVRSDAAAPLVLRQQRLRPHAADVVHARRHQDVAHAASGTN